MAISTMKNNSILNDSKGALIASEVIQWYLRDLNDKMYQLFDFLEVGKGLPRTFKKEYLLVGRKLRKAQSLRSLPTQQYNVKYDLNF